MITLASRTLFRLATTLAVLLAVVGASAACAGTAHARQVDDSLPPLADLTIASEYSERSPLRWIITVKNNTVGAHPGMQVFLVKVRITVSDPVRGDITSLWTIRDLPPGGSVRGPMGAVAALRNVPGATDGPEWVTQRLYAEIIESNPVESPRFRFNNATEHWAIENRYTGGTNNGGQVYATNGDVGIIEVPRLSDRFPTPGGATTFTVAAYGRSNADSQLRDPLGDIIRTLEQDHRLLDVQVQISLSPGLSFAANQPDAPSGTTFDASAGIWNIDTIHPSVKLSLPVAVNLTANSLDDLSLQERCLTAKVVSAKPSWFANDPLDRQNDTATACLGKATALFSSGTMDLVDFYPCVGVTDYPCTSADTLELVAAQSFDTHFEYLLQPESFIVHVPDPEGRRLKGGSVIWSTVNLMSLRYNQTRLTSSWEVQESVTVTAPGGGEDAPGRWLLTNTDDSFLNNFNLLDAVDSTPVMQEFFDLSVISNDPDDYYLDAKVDFWALGTYEALLGISGRLSGTTYTDSGTYTFHVGPMVDLEVRDAGAGSRIPAGQRAFRIVAVNHGPDAPPAVEVKITGLSASDVQSHSATTGSFNPATGIWTIGELKTKEYTQAVSSRDGSSRDGEVLTIIPSSSSDVKEIGASITNTQDYQVCIDSSGDDVEASSGSACTGTTGNTWHTTKYYDRIEGNESATISQHKGTGEWLPPTLDVTGLADAAMLVRWTELSSLYRRPVTHYEIERSADGGSSWAPLPGPAVRSVYVDVDARPADNPVYRVRAVNDLNYKGPWSLPREAQQSITAGAPDAPALAAKPNEPNGDTEMLLTWKKPVENGSAIESYTLEVSDTGRNGSWADTDATLGPGATSWTHTGLPDGTTKYYRLLATNAQGDSPWSNVVEAKTRAADLPAPPENVRAAPDGGNAIDVSWDEPKRPAGHEGWNITRYEVQRSADGLTGWRGAGRAADGDTLTFKDTGLAFGETRYYRVAARNSRGQSDWSYPPYASATTLRGVPGQPTLTARAESHDTINLKWTKPTDNDSTITHYEIQWSEDGRPGSWQYLPSIGPADVTAYADSGLDPVTTRHYRVRAVNGAGAGTWSRAASATTPVEKERDGKTVGRPTAPLNLVVLAGDGSIDAVWDPPANDGGAEIKDYSVQFRGSGSWEDVPHDGTHTSIFEHSNRNLLTNGRRYYVRVAAINESGHTGPYAQASAVPNKPQLPPSEPRNVEQTGGHGHIVVTWREPYDPGHPELSGYRVQYRENGSDEWLPATPISAAATDRSATITGLTNGTTYQVLVWAVNRAGDSPRAGADGALKATPQQADGATDDERPPTNPRNLRLSPGTDRITVSWSAPSDRGDPAFTEYQVQYRCRWCGYDEWAEWKTVEFGDQESTTSTRATITGLESGVDYQVRVITLDNGYGNGLAIAQTRTR